MMIGCMLATIQKPITQDIINQWWIAVRHKPKHFSSVPNQLLVILCQYTLTEQPNILLKLPAGLDCTTSIYILGLAMPLSIIILKQ